MSSIISKQPSLTCSCCSSSSNINLLDCCLILNCESCLGQHSCEFALTILPLSLGSQYQQCLTKKCSRCSNIANVKCQTCKGKLFCSDCSKLIHQQKYIAHTLSKIESNQILANKSSGRKVKKILTFDDSKSSIIFDDKQNTESSYVLQTLNSKLTTKIMQISYFKQQIEHKQMTLQRQIKNSFHKLKLELQIKQKDVLFSLSETFKSQMQVLTKMAQDLEISIKALNSLVEVGLTDPQLKYLSRSKKLQIIDDLKKIDKRINILQGVQIKYLESNISNFTNQIPLLNLFQKSKTSNVKITDSASTLTQRSERLERLQSKSISKKSIPHLMKKSSATAMSHNTSRQSIMESPKESTSNILHSSRFNNKNCKTTTQSSVSEYRSPHKHKKTQTGQPSNYKIFYQSNKLEECISSKRLMGGSFVALSPDKSCRKIKF